MSRYELLVAVVPTYFFFTVAETEKSSKTHRLEASSVHVEPGCCWIDDMSLLIDHSLWPFSLYITTTGINLTCTERTPRKCYSTNNILPSFHIIASKVGFFFMYFCLRRAKDKQMHREKRRIERDSKTDSPLFSDRHQDVQRASPRSDLCLARERNALINNACLKRPCNHGGPQTLTDALHY